MILRRAFIRWAIVAVPAVLFPFVLFGFLSFWSFEDALLPQVEARTQIASQGLVRQLEFNAAFFGSLGDLREVGAALDSTRDAATDMAFIAVYDEAGSLVAMSPAGFALPDQVASIGQEAASEAGWRDTLTGLIDTLHRAVTGSAFFEDAGTASYVAGPYLVTEFPVGAGDAALGRVTAGTELALLQDARIDIALETLTISIAALLIGFEFVLLLILVNLARPLEMLRFLDQRLRSRDLRYDVETTGGGSLSALVAETNRFIKHASDRAIAQGSKLFRTGQGGQPATVSYPAARYIRLPLFLFFLGEALLRPALPVFLAGLPSDLPFDDQTLAGLAMSMFLLTSIVGVLLGGILAERAGIKRTVLIGMAVIALGTVLHVAVQDIVTAATARGISGLGYGLAYAAAQLFVLRHTDKSRRTSGFSFFFVVVVAAEISGPAIGGILTDRLGTSILLMTASVCMAAGVLVAAWILPTAVPNLPDATSQTPSPARESDPDAPVALRRNSRFVVLVSCFSMPGKMMLNGAIFLAVPLAIAELGLNATEIGRLLMVYGVVILAVSPLLARLADQFEAYAFYTFGGTLLAAVGLLIPGLMPGLWALYAAVVLFALGQAMSVPAQMTLLLGLTERECDRLGAGVVMGRYRFYERLGSFLGPVLVGALLAVGTPNEATFALGLFALLVGTVGTVFFLAVGSRDEEEAIDALLVKG